MRWPRRLTFLALATFIPAIVGDARAEMGPDPQQDRAGVPAALLALLPPASRSPSERTRLVEGHASRGAYVTEHIILPEGDRSHSFDVEYTVDPELDTLVRGILEAKGVSLGHVILMDPASGEIFSYVSTDPGRFPATRPYPTASLMKVVTAAAVLRNAPKAANRDCRYLGSPWELQPDQLEPPAKGGLIESFRRAIAHSNNQCFARLAVHDVGGLALLAEMRQLALLDAPAASHPAGRVELPQGRLALGYLGSGMAGSFITPLAAARLAAALSRGELVEPHWIARVHDAAGELLALPARASPRQVWSTEIADELRSILVGVTESGTAMAAFRDRSGLPLLGSIRVAGKTGTASGTQPTGRYQWFIGLAPADAPRIAIAAIVVDEPSARRSASQIAAATLHSVFCTSEACDASRVERLHARARAQEEELDRELAAREPEPSSPHVSETPAAPAVNELDQSPRPIGVAALEFPRHLRHKKVNGKVVLLLELSADGEVMDAKIDSSDLPAFNEFVAKTVKGWRFTPPTQGGRPVEAKARLPIPIQVR
jgi:TonB family protein